MSHPFLDTDILIRFLTGDDLKKQARSARLLAQIESGLLTVVAPLTVFADCVYVLSSPRLYNLARREVSAVLTPLVRLRHLMIKDRRMLIKALAFFADTTLDFGDCIIAASMQVKGSKVLYSYDKGFDRLPWISREEPQD